MLVFGTTRYCCVTPEERTLTIIKTRFYIVAAAAARWRRAMAQSNNPPFREMTDISAGRPYGTSRGYLESGVSRGFGSSFRFLAVAACIMYFQSQLFNGVTPRSLHPRCRNSIIPRFARLQNNSKIADPENLVGSTELKRRLTVSHSA